MITEETMALIAEGSISALERLYRETYRQVFLYILSMTKDRHTAEDLMHDTYMRIFEKADRYQKGTSVETWMMTIARNIAYDHFRSRKKIIPLEECIAGDDSTYARDDSVRVLENIALETAIRELPDLNAEITVLYGICGYKHREIADILLIPEGTVRRRYRDAIRQLRNIMEGKRDE